MHRYSASVKGVSKQTKFLFVSREKNALTIEYKYLISATSQSPEQTWMYQVLLWQHQHLAKSACPDSLGTKYIIFWW